MNENRPNPPIRKRRVTGTIRRDRLKTEYLERIAIALERLVPAVVNPVCTLTPKKPRPGHPTCDQCDGTGISTVPDWRCGQCEGTGEHSHGF